MAGMLPVLTFHALDDQPSVISFSPRVFRQGMVRLHGHGYCTLGLAEAVSGLRRPVTFPERSLVITFDDGYESVYTEAFPVLQGLGWSAIIFLTVGPQRPTESGGRMPSLNGRDMLTWPQIQEMHRYGMAFGAHTLTHPDLTRLPDERVILEVCESKATIEDRLGTRVACFAYPYGRYGQRSREIVRRYFACACSDRLGLVTATSDPYALERVDAYYLRTDRRFNVLLAGWFPWYIRARSVPRRIRRAAQRGSRSWADRFASA